MLCWLCWFAYSGSERAASSGGLDSARGALRAGRYRVLPVFPQQGQREHRPVLARVLPAEMKRKKGRGAAGKMTKVTKKRPK
jgi:hypothetical protein